MPSNNVEPLPIPNESSDVFYANRYAIGRSARPGNRKIVTGSTHELQPDGKILIRESARNGHRRKTADITDAAERIREDQSGLEVQAQGCRWNRLRCSRDHVERL